MLEKKGQVWIETVIYTLIGITIIAVVLAIVTPQINKTKDKNLIEQTLNAMNILSDSISEVEQTGAGNIRVVEFRVAKGRLEIDGLNNKIVYILEDTKLELSEVGQSISEGNVDILTEKKGSKFVITLTRKYPNLDITNGGKDNLNTLQAGGSSYKISIENKGSDPNDNLANPNIDFSIL